MFATQVALHDVEDVEGFVHATIRRSGLVLELDEYEELVAEGRCIMFELARRYEPHRAGYANGGSFAGFASMFLSRRLGDYWHASHPEHRYRTTENGKRAWEYGAAPVTLDDEENPITVVVEEALEEGEVVRAAIARLAPWERSDARKLVELYDEGQIWSEIARGLDMTRDQLRDLAITLGRAMTEVRREAT